MNLPSNVIEICEKANARNPAEIDKSVKESLAKIQRLPDYDKIVEMLVIAAVRDVIYEVRHKSNLLVRNFSKTCHSVPKVVVGKSKAVQLVSQEMYLNYCIDGTVLRKMTKEQLLQGADVKAAQKAGLDFDERLQRRIANDMPDGAVVGAIFSEKKLKQIFQEVQNKASELPCVTDSSVDC